MPPTPIFSRTSYLLRRMTPCISSEVTRSTDWSRGQVAKSLGYEVLQASQYFMGRRRFLAGDENHIALQPEAGWKDAVAVLRLVQNRQRMKAMTAADFR